MDIALVEHAQHDVHGDNGGDDEQQFVGQGILERRRCALQDDPCALRQPERALGLIDGRHRIAEGGAGREVERHVGGGKLPEMIDDQRSPALAKLHHRTQLHLPAAGGGQVDIVERAQPPAELGSHFQHHAILVGLGEDVGNQPLAESIVQGGVDCRGSDAETAGSIAVDVEVGLQPVVLEIAGHGTEPGRFSQHLDQAGHPRRQHSGVGIFHDQAVLAAAYAVLDGQVLDRLQVQRNAADQGRVLLQPPHHLRQVALALPPGLEVDQHAAGIEAGVAAVHADEGRQAVDRGIVQDHVRQRLLALRHGGERDGRTGL
ncbi:hypothetical protein GALL_505570 [mine drainage metagenome]|uniref:Uncharacterized protein n=1 Tax=mine drainage metagenome TaxID=410659 RepID=A0A1J5PW98_9ZZZZ